MGGGTHQADWAQAHAERRPPAPPKDRHRTALLVAGWCAVAGVCSYVTEYIVGPDGVVASWITIAVPMFFLNVTNPVETGRFTRAQMCSLVAVVLLALLPLMYLSERGT